MRRQLTIFDALAAEPTTTPADRFSLDTRRDCPSCYELLAEGPEFLIVRSHLTQTKYWLNRANGGLIRYLG
jgi:hypothetical protein